MPSWLSSFSPQWKRLERLPFQFIVKIPIVLVKSLSKIFKGLRWRMIVSKKSSSCVIALRCVIFLFLTNQSNQQKEEWAHAPTIRAVSKGKKWAVTVESWESRKLLARSATFAASRRRSGLGIHAHAQGKPEKKKPNNWQVMRLKEKKKKKTFWKKWFNKHSNQGIRAS